MTLSLRLRERSQTQRAKCYMIPFIRNIQIRQICRVCLGLGGGLLMRMGFLFGVMKMFSNWLWWWFHMCKYTKNHWIVLYNSHPIISKSWLEKKNFGMGLIWLATTTLFRVTHMAKSFWRKGRPEHRGGTPAVLKPCLNLHGISGI